MSDQKREQKLSREIRILAGQLGEILHPEQVGPSDAEHYDFQVLVGLADATVNISNFNPERLFYWLGYCLIGLGVNVDPRISALMDALMNEVISQLEAADEEDTESS